MKKLPPPIITTTTVVSNPKNPYSVTNMRITVANLLINDIQLINNNQTKFAKGKVMFAESNNGLSINRKLSAEQSAALASSSINATHYYIKFIPRNEADYNKLKLDSNLVIYPFPLDNEITQYKGNYRDPAVAKGIPTYQYAAIPVGYKLPDVPYQKLEDLFLPDVSNTKSTLTLRADDGSSYSINSLTLANRAECGGNEEPGGPDVGEHEEEMPVEEDCGGGGSYPPGDPYSNGDEWKPNGRITMFDDSHGRTIGVEGIKVRARRWFTTYEGITNADGYYAVDGWFTRPANYWLDFERHDYAIKYFDGYTHEISGPKIEAPWNLDLTNSYDKFVATIFRAAFHYYHKDIHGLHRPPQNSFWAAKLHILANPAPITNSTSVMYPIGWHLGETIIIDGMLASAATSYSTAIHEIAHAAHWDKSNTSLLLSSITVSESWATGVEWYLTKMEYPNYPGVNWPGNVNYRNVVIDLIDTPSDISFQTNPLNFNNFGFPFPVDQVQGYNIVEIQNAVINYPTTWNEWKNNIINNNNNGTSQHVDALFNAWNNF